MNAEVHLNNDYFPWNHIVEKSREYWIKGNFFLKRHLSVSQLISIFSSFPLQSQDLDTKIDEMFRHLNGTFAVIIETPGSIFCAVDRVRSIPLFYSLKDGCFIVSDDAHYVKERLNSSFNEECGAEYLVTGYVTGPETLYTGIRQLQAGEYLLFNKMEGKLALHRYFQYLHGNYSGSTEGQLLEDLDTVMIGVFKRLIETTIGKEKTIIVPLSGGLDSRLIVAMLKRLGVENVICFSYGRKGDFQSKISKKIASALGYEWHFVEYTRDRWEDCYQSPNMKSYELLSQNLVSLPHEQDFLAVKILKEEGILPNNAVFVPGHSADMLSGSWIPSNIRDVPQNDDQFIRTILAKHYHLWIWNKKQSDLEGIFRKRVQKSGEGIDIHDADSLTNAIEYFNFNERQAKFIINSVRVYEFHGYEWRLPYWDTELIDFFLSVPIKYRIHQSLYKKYALNKVFKDELAGLREITCSTPLVPMSKFGRNFLDILYIERNIEYYLDRMYTWIYHRNTERDLYGIYHPHNLYSHVIIKNPGLDKVSNFPLITSILSFSIENRFELSFNGAQSLKQILTLIPSLSIYVQEKDSV